MQTLLDAGQIEELLAAMASEILADPAFGGGGGGGAVRPALVGVRSRGEILAQRLAAVIAERRKAGEGVAGGGMGDSGRVGTRGDGGADGASDGGVDVGALDITLYRDDLSSRSAMTIPQGTEMNFAIDDRPVILVDDVLETGRSARAALDAIVDFGRPSVIRLAVLIDRGRREFPIAADYVGLHVPHAQAGQKIVVQLKPTDAEDGVFLR